MHKPPQELVDEYAGQDVEFIPHRQYISAPSSTGMVNHELKITWEVRPKLKSSEKNSTS